MAFNLVLALAAVPAARGCVRGNPAVATASDLTVFAAATAGWALAPSLGVLIAARAVQAVGGALVIMGGLELLVAASGDEGVGARRWAAAGVAGAALGAGGRRTVDVGVLVAVDLRRADPGRVRCAARGSRGAGSRGAAPGRTRHDAGPPACAGQPGAGAGLGGPHGGAVPAGAVAG